MAFSTRVMASFAGHHFPGLPRSLANFRRPNETAMASFQLEKYYMVSYRSNNTTGSSLIVLHWQRSFLAISACYKMLTQHYTRDTAGHYAIACNVHSCGYSDIVLGSP